MLTRQDQEAELIFAMVMKLGGEHNYSEHTKAAIWGEATRNPKLRNLALQYLAGSSTRAELNLHRLHTEIVEVFFPEVKELLG